MKPIDLAIIGVRLTALASMVFGVVLALSSILVQILSGGAQAAAADLRLHDTYYVVVHLHYEMIVPSGVGLVMGLLLFWRSRQLGALLARGIERD